MARPTAPHLARHRPRHLPGIGALPSPRQGRKSDFGIDRGRISDFEAVAGQQPGAGVDPISHCLAGNSLLLTGLPGTGKTHLAPDHCGEAGEAVRLVSKTHCSAQNLGLGAQTADHWVRRYVRGGSAQKLDWLVVEEITQLDIGPGLRGAERRRKVPAGGRLPAVAGRAGLLGRAISAPLEHSQLIRDLTGGHRHELTENMRHLQLREVAAGRRGGVPHAGAGQGEAEGALPLQARGCASLGPAERYPRVFVAVAEVEPDGVRLQRPAAAAGQPSHA